MKRVSPIVLGSYFLLLLVGCRHTPSQPVQLHRLEKVMFDTPTNQQINTSTNQQINTSTNKNQLQQTLSDRQSEFNTPLLTLYPDDPAFMQQVEGFVSDPVIIRLYELVDSTFGDMEAESMALGEAMDRMKNACPSMRYDKIYTYISGTMDYANRVVCNSHECLVSIDQYVLPSTGQYAYFGTPQYLVRQSQPKYLVPDCLAAMAREHIALTQATPSLLDYMVAEGKALYLASICLPHTPDSILLRYSAEQYEWAVRNEEHIWSFFLQNNLLFESDYMRIHNFTDEAPQTNAFRAGSEGVASAPRTTDYIGLRIVRQYMKKTAISVQDLFDETDSQKILNESKYRPDKR